MQPNQPGDEALAAAARQGDGDAFAALVQRYAGRLLDKIARITGDVQESEDLVQEAFLRAFRSLPQYRPELPFRPWLYRISTNLALDWCRRRESRRRAGLAALPARRPGHGDDVSRSDGDRWWEGAALGLEGASPTPEEEVEARDRSRMVRQAVAALPPRYRAAVILHYYHELSYKEVAEVLGISHRTVGTRLYRAKQLLAAHLRCQEAGENIGRQPV